MNTQKMNFTTQYIASNPDSNEALLQKRVEARLVEATAIFEKLELWEEVENLEEDEEVLNWFLFGAELFDIEHLQKSKAVYVNSEYGLFIAKTSDWESFIESLMDGLYNTTI